MATASPENHGTRNQRPDRVVLAISCDCLRLLLSIFFDEINLFLRSGRPGWDKARCVQPRLAHWMGIMLCQVWLSKMSRVSLERVSDRRFLLIEKTCGSCMDYRCDSLHLGLGISNLGDGLVTAGTRNLESDDFKSNIIISTFATRPWTGQAVQFNDGITTQQVF
jgi:hypothetical protein